MPATCEQRFQDMLDHYEISRCVAEYVHGCDRCDEPMMAGAYWPDSWDDHGNVKAAGPEFARVMTQQVLASCETLSHHLGQTLVTVSGDQAGAETYYLAVTRGIGSDGQPICNQLGGRYVDRLERRDGIWKISHRTCLRDWSVTLDAGVDHFLNANLTAGRRDGLDPSYPALGLSHGGQSPA